MLLGRRGFGNLDIDTAGSESEPEEPEDGAVVEADAASAEENVNNPDGPPSKRLRLRKGALSQAEDDDPISGAEEDSDGGQPALYYEDSDGEEREVQSQRNTAAARAQRALNTRVRAPGARSAAAATFASTGGGASDARTAVAAASASTGGGASDASSAAARASARVQSSY